jgi:predicted acyltransferase
MEKSTSISQRNIALDVFRGLTVCFMIIVNTSGNGDTTYWPLRHADWNGFTPTDLVFPSFLFAVGNALSFARRKWPDMSPSEVIRKILKRMLLIFLIGFLMYWFPFFRPDTEGHWMFSSLSHTRIMGVLQRIALCYGISALLIYYFGTKKILWIGALILPVYWILLLIFGIDGAEFTKTGNAVLRLDMWFLGINHLYTGEGFPFDPEGILSTIPALFNVIAGYLVGVYIQKNGLSLKGLTKIILTGALFVFVAILWNEIMPINKKIWTSSFALLTVGLDLIFISLIIWMIDVLKFQKGTYFFLVAGKNPLFIYLLSELGVTILLLIKKGDESLFHWIYWHVFVYAGDYFGSFLFAVWWMLTCWLVGYFLDKKKVYIRI